MPLSLLILFALLLAAIGFFVAAAFDAAPVLAPLCGVCLIAACAGLGDGAAASLTLPFGLPGLPAVFAVDRVTLMFLPPFAIAGAAAASMAGGGAARLAAMLGAAVVMLCAGDASLLLLGTGLAVLSAGRPVTAVVIVLLLAASLSGLLPHGLLPQQSLPALRSQAAAAAPALAVLLVLAPAAMLAGMAGGTPAGWLMPVLGAFLLVRVLFDLSGPSTPFAWGLLVAGAGLAGAIERGVRAAASSTLDGTLSLAGMPGLLAVTGFGVALAARAADLPAVASAALAGALLLVLVAAAAVPLASIALACVAEQAGSRRLAALGGLSAPMRWTFLAALAGFGTIAGLPPLAGFAPVWLVVQSLLSAQRFGGLATPILLALALASLGLALGLGLAAALRVLLVVFGGRPRTPRGAAAAEARRPALRVMAALSGLLLVADLLPGLPLRLFEPAITALTGVGMGGRAGPFAVAAAAGGAVWAPLPVLLLLAAPAAGLFFLWRREAAGARDAPVWDGGASPAPEWLPFGEPLVQASAAGLSRPLLLAIGIEEGASGRRWRPALAAAVRGLRRAGRRLGGLDRAVAGAAPALVGAAAVIVLLAVLLIGGHGG